MSKIVEFKNKTEKFKKWLNNCAKDFDKHPPKSAVLIWEAELENGSTQAFHSKYDCDINTFAYFLKCMEDKYFEMRMEKYLSENLDNFIEFV